MVFIDHDVVYIDFDVIYIDHGVVYKTDKRNSLKLCYPTQKEEGISSTPPCCR